MVDNLFEEEVESVHCTLYSGCRRWSEREWGEVRGIGKVGRK